MINICRVTIEKIYSNRWPEICQQFNVDKISVTWQAALAHTINPLCYDADFSGRFADMNVEGWIILRDM